MKALGTSDLYVESASRLDEFFGASGFPGAIKRAVSKGILPPFSDAGPQRRVGWQQLGAQWFVEWSNDYETAQASEGFCATLQILLEDLRTVELSLLPTDVVLKIKLHDGNLKIDDDSDNSQIRPNVRLPRTPSTTGRQIEMAGLVQGVAASALQLLSAIPQEQFLKIYEQRIKSGLLNKFSPYAAYDRLFREFYSQEDFKAHYDRSRGVQVELPVSFGKTDPGLSGPAGLHPSYNKTESERLIQKRYDKILPQLKYTLPRLMDDISFRAAVAQLKKEGWKDWHILQAIASVRLNHLLNTAFPHPADFAQMREASKSLYERAEQATDPVLPLELFTVAQLKRALTFTQAATLKGLGFVLSQSVLNVSGLNKFLERFNYWIDDIPHSQMFPE